MPSLKDIRKRIGSVKSTQKITSAMKMVAGARLNKAQRRITEIRPYAVKTQQVIAEVTAQHHRKAAEAAEAADEADAAQEDQEPIQGYLEGYEEVAEGKLVEHPLLERRAERRVLLVVLTSDRGLCGSFNANICKLAEREWRSREKDGQEVSMLVVGRRGRDYFTRRGATITYVDEAWKDLGWSTGRDVGRRVLGPFLAEDEPVDAIYLVYSQFKSAMTQEPVCDRLLPVPEPKKDDSQGVEFLFEPNKENLLEQLVPMYVQVSILRALYESMASELGARMTAMDAATTNASEMIDKLTLKYNRARQAAITTELMEIIGGSEALKG